MKFNVKPEGEKRTCALLWVLGVLAAVSVTVAVLAWATDLFCPPRQLAQLVLYKGPKPIAPSETAHMWADGNELFVYDTAVNNTHTWDSRYNPPLSTAQVASFDFADGEVELKIELSAGEDMGQVTVRPLSYGIEPQVEGNTLRFRISRPDVYTVEYQGSSSKAMHIFANAIDEDAPTESSDTVKYIGPGAWIADTMVLEDGMDVYISGGAVIRGTLIGNKVHDATVRGHGFFDGSNNKSWMLNKMTAYIPVSLRESQNVSVSGIGILNPNAWCVELYSCDNVDISGIKIISARPNGDGISVQSCRNVTVRDSFIRTWDDSLVVKNYSNRKGSDSADILFDGCQLWTDLAQSMEIGYETNKGGKLKPTIQNVTFSNITVLHNFHKPVMSIHNADDAEVSGIVFHDITVEDASMGKGDAGKNCQLIDITIAQSSWSTSKKRGTVHDILFDGISVLDGDDGIDFKEGNLCPIRIQGFDEEHLCRDITIRNLEILGKKVTQENYADNPDTAVSRFTDNIVFE